MGNNIQPRDPSLLTDQDVDYEKFSCCGDEDLVFLRCFGCKHIWIECYECSTWYTDLADLNIRQQAFMTSDEQRLKCPACEREFEHAHYLSEEHCDQYLATRTQVIQAGHGTYLADKPRSEPAVARPQKRRVPYGAILGGSLGAAGWLLGMTLKALTIGQLANAVFPAIAAILVIMVGVWLLMVRMQGKRIRVWTAIQILMFASACFGMMACLALHWRDGLEPLIDPQEQYPLIVNFLAPIIIVMLMGVLMIPKFKNFLNREYL